MSILNHILLKFAYHLIRQCKIIRDFKNFFRCHPFRHGQLIFLNNNIIRSIQLAEKSKQQTLGIRPRLTFVVFQIFHMQMRLFIYFPGNSFLNGFTDFCKTCYQRIMIHADFVKTGDLLTGFCLTGHAGYDDYGHDIVCASVTSAVQMAANGITEVLKLGAQVDVGENEIKMTLDRADAKKGQAFLQALLLHLNLLSEDYEGTIQVNLSEVYNNA